MAQKIALAIKELGIKPGEIPDEQCEVLSSGELRIFVNLPREVTIEMIVPEDQWTPMARGN